VTRPVEVFTSRGELARRAASLVEQSLEDAWAEGRVARLALSGGSTPRRTYELLGAGGKLANARVEIFFADERCVPPSDHASNYRLVAETIGDHDNVRRIRGELTSEEAADEYEAVLREPFGAGPPVFDLILLGIGADGHTASLFPGEPELEERKRWVVATKRPHAWVRRVTLTLPVLNAARQALMLATGAEKAKAVAGILSGGTSPAARVLGARLLLDEAAAGAGSPPPKRGAKPATDELLDIRTESDVE
jgi:6-phosphogluconolactonase